jgi:hypothetical protein
MAEFVVGGKVVIDDKQATDSVKSIKAQLKDAQKELIAVSDKFGETSVEAINAAKAVANLKDKIGDAKALSDAFSPDKKFAAFSSALAGVAGGFAAVQGAQALLGAESEDTQKALLKVQSAMSLAQGLSSVTESIDAFKNLGAVVKSFSVVQKIITAGQWLWNAAMAANPIGAVVAAIAALIAGVVALTKYFIDNADAAKQNAAAVEANAAALDKQRKANETANDQLQRSQQYQLGMAKANGESTKSIRALELKLIDEKIAFANSSREAAINTLEKNKNTLASLKASGASDELIKSQQEITTKSLEEANKQTKAVNDANKEKFELQRKHNIDVVTEQTAADNKAAEARKAAADKAREKQQEVLKQQAADEAAAQKQLLKARQDNFLNEITDKEELAKEKLRIDYENGAKEIEQTKATEETKNALLIELGKKYWADLAAIEDKATADIQAKATLQAEENNKKRQEATEKKLADEQKAKDEAVKIAQAEADQKKAILDAQFGALDATVGFLKEISGKSKALQKTAIIAEGAIGIAKMVIANQTANIAALATPQAIATGGAAAAPVILFNNIKTALGVATTIAATAKALSALGGGGGATGGANTNAGGGGGSAPLPPQASSTLMNQGQVNQLSSATARAFVLESDVTGNQERIQRLNRQARIN